MKFYTILLLLIAISILLYFGYKLNDIPKTLKNTKSSDIDVPNQIEIISKSNVFFDISVGEKNIGRVIIELFDEDVPLTCNNFRHLCTKGIKKNNISEYKNTKYNA